METISLLLDEHVPEYLADELVRLEPAISVNQVGLPDAPPKGTRDPELLLFAEANGMAIITTDKRTMKSHVVAHLASDRHTAGIVMLRAGHSIRDLAEDLILLWSSWTVEDWRDSWTWVPL